MKFGELQLQKVLDKCDPQILKVSCNLERQLQKVLDKCDPQILKVSCNLERPVDFLVETLVDLPRDGRCQ